MVGGFITLRGMDEAKGLGLSRFLPSRVLVCFRFFACFCPLFPRARTLALLAVACALVCFGCCVGVCVTGCFPCRTPSVSPLSSYQHTLAHIHTYTHTHIHTYTHIHIHTHTHVSPIIVSPSFLPHSFILLDVFPSPSPPSLSHPPSPHPPLRRRCPRCKRCPR